MAIQCGNKPCKNWTELTTYDRHNCLEWWVNLPHNCGFVEAPKKARPVGSAEFAGSISFDDLAKDCPALNIDGKCTIRATIGAYYPITCRDSMCPPWHFIKTLMVQK